MKISSLRRTLGFAVLIAIFGVYVPISAAEMVLLSAHRAIAGQATQMEPMEESSDDWGVFDTEFLNTDYVREGRRVAGTVTVSASQSSLISENKIRGFGRGSGFGTGLDGQAEAQGASTMNVQFEVDEVMSYTLSGLLRITPHGLGLNGSLAFLRLLGPSGPVFDVSMNEGTVNGEGVVDFSQARSLSGEFGPGCYELLAFAQGRGADRMTRCADFDFDFSIVEASAVPEPGLVGGLLVGLLLVCRHRTPLRGRG